MSSLSANQNVPVIGMAQMINIIMRRIHVIEIVDANLAESLCGLFMRVLVVMPNNQSGYAIGRIIGVEHGLSYTGFAFDKTKTTDILFRLDLSDDLTQKSGVLYQLNSVSNSPMKPDEFEKWQQHGDPITLTEYESLVERQTAIISQMRRQAKDALARSKAKDALAGSNATV